MRRGCLECSYFHTFYNRFELQRNYRPSYSRMIQILLERRFYNDKPDGILYFGQLSRRNIRDITSYTPLATAPPDGESHIQAGLTLSSPVTIPTAIRQLEQPAQERDDIMESLISEDESLRKDGGTLKYGFVVVDDTYNVDESGMSREDSSPEKHSSREGFQFVQMEVVVQTPKSAVVEDLGYEFSRQVIIAIKIPQFSPLSSPIFPCTSLTIARQRLAHEIVKVYEKRDDFLKSGSIVRHRYAAPRRRLTTYDNGSTSSANLPRVSRFGHLYGLTCQFPRARTNSESSVQQIGSEPALFETSQESAPDTHDPSLKLPPLVYQPNSDQINSCNRVASPSAARRTPGKNATNYYSPLFAMPSPPSDAKQFLSSPLLAPADDSRPKSTRPEDLSSTAAPATPAGPSTLAPILLNPFLQPHSWLRPFLIPLWGLVPSDFSATNFERWLAYKAPNIAGPALLQLHDRLTQCYTERLHIVTRGIPDPNVITCSTQTLQDALAYTSSRLDDIERLHGVRYKPRGPAGAGEGDAVFGHIDLTRSNV